MRLKGLYFDCQVDGCAPDTFAVTEFTLDEHLSELFTLTLTVISADADIDIKSLILCNAHLTVSQNGVFQREVIGIITEAKRGKSGFRQTYYTLIVRPSLWLLTQRQQSRIFHFKSIPEVLDILLQEHQIRICCDCRDKHTQREFITQKRETDYAFFCRLAAEEGITFWFEVNKGEAQCLYTDSFLSVLGGDTLEYNDHPQSSTEGDFAYQMNLSARMTPQKAIGKDRTYLHPRFSYQHEVRGDTLQGTNTSLYTIYDSFARFPDYDSAEQMTRYRLEVLQRESEYGEGESNCFALRPGYYFQLCGHPSAALNEKWQVVAAVHHGVLPQSGQEDFSDTAASLTNHFRFIGYYKNWRPTFIPKPIADGPEVAEVVGPAGEEIFTNKLGQVKVHFHWNLYDEADEKASCWVRVMQGWSGRGYGFYAIPRIGQEVIVSYINGDIDRPIITGCTYNDIMALPVQLPEKKTQTVFRTQTHKGQGHNELRFDDATGNELLHLHAQKDMDIHVLNDHTVNIEHDSKHHIKNDSHLKIDNECRVHAKNDISLSTDSDLHINASQGIFAQGKNEIHLESGMKIVIDAGAEITLQAANNFIKIDSTGIHTSSVFNIGSGSAGKGTGWRGKLPSGLFTERTQLLPLNRNQRLVLLSNTPFCEECEKCKQEGGCAI
jgi:type VI secretion system secreted protein VgrG